MSYAKVVIAAGGTGGHMFPAQALARDLQSRGIEVLFIGAKLDTNKYFHRDLFPFVSISSSSFIGRGIHRYIYPFLSLSRGMIQSFKELKRFRPDVIIGFGSFHSAPVLMAAVATRSPFFLFESNAWPGKVNRIFSSFAKLSVVQFEKTRKYLKSKTLVAGVPLWHRGDMYIPSKEEALAYFGLTNDKPTLLVFGGSQGARSINMAAYDVMKVAFEQGNNMQIIHIVGDPKYVAEYEEGYRSLGASFCVKPFEDKMVFAWSAADFAICRAGAATIAEMIRFEVPSILIPFPRAKENHQYLNAKELKDMGAAFCVSESELNFHVLYKALEKMLDQKHYLAMKNIMHSFASTVKTSQLSDVVAGFVKKKTVQG